MDNENEKDLWKKDYDDLWDDEEKPVSKLWLIPIVIGTILFVIVIYSIISGGNSEAKFYKETCPKLNASFAQETLGRKCFKKIDGEIKFYRIKKIEGVNYLVVAKD